MSSSMKARFGKWAEYASGMFAADGMAVQTRADPTAGSKKEGLAGSHAGCC